MKSLILATVLSTLAVTTASAGLFDQLATSNWEVRESEAYKVEAYGFDFRVYEWKSKTNPDITCSVAIGNADHAPYMGLQCFPTVSE